MKRLFQLIGVGYLINKVGKFFKDMDSYARVTAMFTPNTDKDREFRKMLCENRNRFHGIKITVGYDNDKNPVCMYKFSIKCDDLYLLTDFTPNFKF